MRRLRRAGWAALALAWGAGVSRGEVAITRAPAAERVGNGARITFAISGPTDVEVAVLNAAGKVVRHLAAGVLGGAHPPPAPLRAGLAQEVTWDGKDDFGKPAGAGPFTVRVRAGTGVAFGRLIGADPYNLGRVIGSAVDEDGNLYILAHGGQLNQGHLCLRVFDKNGRYLRELIPFPANLPRDALKDVARWDEATKAYRPINHRNLNPDFYGQASGVRLVSASKTGGIVLASKGRKMVLETNGAVRSIGTDEAPAGQPADLAAFDVARAAVSPKGEKWTGPGERPIDWTRLAVDYERDEVYVNDGICYLWRFDGTSGAGGLLRQGGKPFYAADVAIGYDGLLYVRKCMGYTPGVTDFSGPLERYTRDLMPANYPSGTHVLSKYIYGRYGIGYADRGMGIGPDGTVYVSFMYDWVKYCTAGFGPDGRPLKGKYLEGLVGNRGDPKRGYPPDLTSAVIGPITGAHGGVRVDLRGDLYLGLWVWPKDTPVPAEFAKDAGYLCSVGSVIKFSPAGGFMTSPQADWSSDPLGSTPRTPGAAGIEARSGYRTPTVAYSVFIEGAVAAYTGYAPFSHANWGGNNCCVCRAPRFDVDRYGRLALPNAITNSVLLYDNAGNVILEFGRYANFDAQYVNPNLQEGREGKPTVATPDLPLTWPTGAGFSDGRVYVLDTYSRRVVRGDLTWQAEARCEVK